MVPHRLVDHPEPPPSDPVADVYAFSPPAGPAVRLVGDLGPGQGGYTLARALRVDRAGRCWLCPDYPVVARPDSRARLGVVRRPGGGFGVDLRGLAPGWRPGPADGGEPLAPVVTVARGPGPGLPRPQTG
jgi:hypothetical protein